MEFLVHYGHDHDLTRVHAHVHLFNDFYDLYDVNFNADACGDAQAYFYVSERWCFNFRDLLSQSDGSFFPCACDYFHLDVLSNNSRFWRNGILSFNFFIRLSCSRCAFGG